MHNAMVINSSVLEINNIEPNRYESKFAEVAYLDNIPATPIEALKTTTTPISENLANFLRRISIIRNEITQAMIDINNGFNPAANPIATPAREECARASPEEDNLLYTTPEPIRGRVMPNNKATRKAMRMNS